jgi:hypothetical protein
MNVTKESAGRALETGVKLGVGLCSAAILILAPTLLSQGISISRSMAAIEQRVTASDFAIQQQTRVSDSNMVDIRNDLKALAARMSSVEMGVARIEERTRWIEGKGAKDG